MSADDRVTPDDGPLWDLHGQLVAASRKASRTIPGGDVTWVCPERWWTRLARRIRRTR